MHRQVVVAHFGWKGFKAEVVRADHHRAAILDQELGAVYAQARRIGHVDLRIVVVAHSARAYQHHVALLQLDALQLQRVAQVLAADAIIVRQLLQALGSGHVDQHAACDDGRQFFGAGDGPATVAEVFGFAKAIPDFAVQAEMIQGVDMRTRVGVHRYRRAGITDVAVHLFADLHRIGHDIAMRRMGHPHLVRRIAGRLPARHADIKIDRQVIAFLTRHPAQYGAARGRRDQVQAADLVFRPPRADADLLRRSCNCGGARAEQSQQ